MNHFTDGDMSPYVIDVYLTMLSTQWPWTVTKKNIPQLLINLKSFGRPQ